MRIKVLPPNSAGVKKEEYADFYLRQDNWNDFQYQTLYHLSLSGRHSEDGEPVLIGGVKILKKGQTDSDGLMLGLGEFESLSEDFCSVGQSLDFYERIANLKKELRDYILSSLRDAVIFPKNKVGFESEPGWGASLLRFISEGDDIFTLSPILISKDYKKLPSIELKFSFKTADMESAINFDFDSPDYSLDEKLPGRVIVLVGRNGSGKSTLMSKLSRIAFSSGPDRSDAALAKIGTFEPSGLGFPKIINISYSAFDSFRVPGIYIHEKEQILKDLSRNQGRYIFCGIRDVCKELERANETLKCDDRGRLSESEVLRDRELSTYLKPIEKLSEEVRELLGLIENKKKTKLLLGAFSVLSRESSFKQLHGPVGNGISIENIINSFIDLSTGHKFVIHSIVNLVAHAEKRSLVLFDEPETHLHPPLLAVLMSAIRYVLKKVDAFSIVATHSPVVVQETLAKHVHIIRRSGSITEVIKPEIQTYGESITSITSLVFGLSSDITNFHYELDNALEDIMSGVGKKTDQQILEEFEKLFEGELSVQARAYILSKIISTRS